MSPMLSSIPPLLLLLPASSSLSHPFSHFYSPSSLITKGVSGAEEEEGREGEGGGGCIC